MRKEVRERKKERKRERWVSVESVKRGKEGGREGGRGVIGKRRKEVIGEGLFFWKEVWMGKGKKGRWYVE